MFKRGLRLPVLVHLMLASWCTAGFADSHATAQRSLLMPLASRSLLLDITRAGRSVVAVGERGHALISPGSDPLWTQVAVPTRATLTAVDFLDGKTGFAVGHDAVILRTRDGGQDWERVHFDPVQERPLLDVMVLDSMHVVAVGAYGLYLESRDGGNSWTERVINTTGEGAGPDHPGDDYHLNRIVRADMTRWYMAAEAGTLYRSDDAGRGWRRLPSPYDGSFFGLLTPDRDHVLAFGLQGQLYVSDDAGENWLHLETGTTATLTDGMVVSDELIVIVGHAGVLLVSGDGGRSFRLRQQRRVSTSALTALDNGDLLLVGEDGYRVVARSAAVGSGQP